MRTITTHYMGRSPTYGERYVAVESAGGKEHSAFPPSRSALWCHKAAAAALCAKLKWHGTLACGELKRGQMVHVFVDVKELQEV